MAERRATRLDGSTDATPDERSDQARSDERRRSGAGEEWYRDGLRFQCTCCGNCCTGPEGVVWFTAAEGRAMAERLGLDEAEFHRRHARRVDGRWSLRERVLDDGRHDCVFLDRDTLPGKAICGVYEARPTQCRTWPFWPENLTTRRAWSRAKAGPPCPGMDSGPLIPIERIRILRDSNRG